MDHDPSRLLDRHRRHHPSIEPFIEQSTAPVSSLEVPLLTSFLPVCRPWALALGTPVLVIAGFLHLVQHWFQAKLYNRRQKKVMSQTNDDLTIGPPMSQAYVPIPPSQSSNP